MNTLRKSKLVRFSLIAVVGAMPGCGGDGFLGLEDYQRDLLTGGLLAAALLNNALDPSAGTPQAGRDGIDGLTCWDLDGDGQQDSEEDVNGDGAFDARDCAGQSGQPGQDGAPGQPGQGGIACWDLNANGVGDAAEDINNDGRFDALDCSGLDGQDGQNGNNGSRGPTGPAGEDGIALFHVFVDDFFSAGAPNGNLPVNVVNITEPVLGDLFGQSSAVASVSAVAYRMAIPQVYNLGNDVNMRLFFHRTGFQEGDCFILRLDARRLRSGEGIQNYDFEDCLECGTRYIRIDLDALPVTAAGGNGNTNGNDNGNGNGVFIVLDLPVNTPAGLDFPSDLAPAHFLAFELSVHTYDGAGYQILGAEFTEHRPGDAQLRGATVFYDAKVASCAFDDCNENGIPDDRDLDDVELNCDGNEFVDECEVRDGLADDCNDNGVPDECDLDDGLNDCNQNLVPDDCDIADGTSFDDNTNSIPDECEEICLCHEDVEVVCELVDAQAASSEGVSVFFTLPQVDGTCSFIDSCDDPGTVAGIECVVECDYLPGQFFHVGETTVTCRSSQFHVPAGTNGSPVVDTCSFTVTVLPLPESCNGSFTGTYDDGEVIGEVHGTLDALGNVTMTFVDLFGSDEDAVTSGTVTGCGYLFSGEDLTGLMAIGAVYFSPNGCYGSGSFASPGIGKGEPGPAGTWNIQFANNGG